MRKRGRVDGNHAAIKKALLAIGASVQDLSSVGAGCPDLAVGYHGKTVLVECKVHGGKLTADQTDWFSKWGGSAAVVFNPEQAQQIIIDLCVLEK